MISGTNGLAAIEVEGKQRHYVSDTMINNEGNGSMENKKEQGNAFAEKA